jgi:hypothetical protein
MIETLWVFGFLGLVYMFLGAILAYVECIIGDSEWSLKRFIKVIFRWPALLSRRGLP